MTIYVYNSPVSGLKLNSEGMYSKREIIIFLFLILFCSLVFL